MQTTIDYLASNTVLIALLVGAITPTLTAVINRPSWPKRTRGYVAVIVSLILGFITAATTGTLTDITVLVPTIIAVLVASEATYQKLWRPSGAAAAIEQATSPAVVVEIDPVKVVDEPVLVPLV